MPPKEGHRLCRTRREKELLEKVPHSQYVVTIARMLRVYFKHDRKLLSLFSRSFYQALKEFFREVSEDQNAVPGVIISIQTYGRDPVPFHPHLHCLVSDGCFSRDGQFHPISWVDTEKMMRLFRHRLFQALLAEGIITTRISIFCSAGSIPGSPSSGVSRSNRTKQPQENGL